MTGEAVVLGLRTAKLPSRALAVVLDLAVEFAAFFIVTVLLLTLLEGLDGAAAAALMICMMVFFLVAVPVTVETLTHGRSLGKMALGLRVVRLDGGPARFRHALVRGLVGIIEIILLTGVPAAITSLVNSDGRRLGDIFAGTIVVRERVPAGRSTGPVVAPPPQVMAALGTDLVRLDLSSVPEGLWLAIRQLLGRADQLDAEVAFRMAHQLAGDVAMRTQWPVPAGLHPALYLGAVLTERQRREWQRAAAAAPYAQPMAPSPYAPPVPVPVPSPFAPPMPQFAPPAAPVRYLGVPPQAPAPSAPVPQAPVQSAPVPQAPVQPAPVPPAPVQPPPVVPVQVTPPPVLPVRAAEPQDAPPATAPVADGGFALPG
ncbi:RDD family protein [Kitasatospora azatica]|uniref:RDD family protein n=1 Tax=Kitasatospora azatica TaxID=58347 RepID=UPI0022772F3D|nr:RDD family protein [Kitasatospora azatica]